MPTGAMIHQVSPAQRRLHTTSSRHNFRATRRRPTGRVTDDSGTRMCVNVGAAGSCRVKPRWNQACTVSTPSDTVSLWSADRPCRPPRSSARRRRLCRPARDPTCVKAGKTRTAKPQVGITRKVGIRAGLASRTSRCSCCRDRRCSPVTLRAPAAFHTPDVGVSLRLSGSHRGVVVGSPAGRERQRRSTPAICCSAWFMPHGREE